MSVWQKTTLNEEDADEKIGYWSRCSRAWEGPVFPVRVEALSKWAIFARLRTWDEAACSGPYMMDHTPHFLHHDNLYGKAYAIGYIRALIQTVYEG